MEKKKWSPFKRTGIRINPKTLSHKDMSHDMEELLEKLEALGFEDIKKFQNPSKENYPLKKEEQAKKGHG